jgi:2-succinyl-6-hydroxy-2,4-cyclohexadiene-1-carboxylate synthase
MGGRTALSFAVKNPQKVVALILESSTAGIENKTERNSRIKTDYEIADKILKDGIDAFVQYWLDLPFFKSLKSLSKKEYSNLREQKRKNSTTGLANSLKGFSTGKMPKLWNELNRLSFPTLLIAGSLDRKFVKTNKAIHQAIQSSELSVLENCGHNTHLENPEEFIILVNSFLNNLD